MADDPLLPAVSPSAGHWTIERSSGSAAQFHGRDLPSPLRPTIWVHAVRRPAMVLGSTQQERSIDRSAAEAAGYEVCKRRSGGGLVVVEPSSSRWVDVLIPPSDPHWSDDVGRAFGWVGAAWRDALESLGLTDVSVHAGPLVDGQAGRVVCFAGLGPGEVTVSGRKVVGLSQRRTRDGARFQGLIVSEWDPSPIHRFMDAETLGPDLAARLDDVPVGLERPLDLDAAVDAVLAALTTAPSTANPSPRR